MRFSDANIGKDDCELDDEGGAWPPNRYSIESRTIEQWLIRTPAFDVEVPEGAEFCAVDVPVAIRDDVAAVVVACLLLSSSMLSLFPSMVYFCFLCSYTTRLLKSPAPLRFRVHRRE